MTGTGLGTSSTEDALNEVRSKRPMSRMEVPSDVSSKEALSRDEQARANDPLSSSSGLLSFEIANGHSYVPQLIPSDIDEDQYIEYPLDNLSGFPCNMEEEERMFMEAVIESLKDLEVRHPHEEDKLSNVARHPHEEEQLSNVASESLEASPKGNTESSSGTEHWRLSKSDGSSTSGTNTNDLACEYQLPQASLSSSEPIFDTPPSVIGSGSTGTSSSSDVLANAPSSSANGHKSAQDTDTGVLHLLWFQFFFNVLPTPTMCIYVDVV
ncbi:hypothetical protein IFM89_026845 [Coptis chinensis]|uniref:Uncharacterized protein n=1 Tax=Coptis chinensis TaxID=261450 RepID=A0A835I052_9MAGN|nr:hypothetical protein IFM89_026845 [Coptis chinensis]